SKLKEVDSALPMQSGGTPSGASIQDKDKLVSSPADSPPPGFNRPPTIEDKNVTPVSAAGPPEGANVAPPPLNYNGQSLPPVSNNHTEDDPPEIMTGNDKYKPEQLKGSNAREKDGAGQRSPVPRQVEIVPVSATEPPPAPPLSPPKDEKSAPPAN